MANDSSSSGAIVGIVAIIAILIVVALALKVFQLYPGDEQDDGTNIDINLPTQQYP